MNLTKDQVAKIVKHEIYSRDLNKDTTGKLKRMLAKTLTVEGLIKQLNEIKDKTMPIRIDLQSKFIFSDDGAHCTTSSGEFLLGVTENYGDYSWVALETVELTDIDNYIKMKEIDEGVVL